MFSCTPSVLLAEGAEVIHLMQIYHRGNPPKQQEEVSWDAEYSDDPDPYS